MYAKKFVYTLKKIGTLKFSESCRLMSAPEPSPIHRQRE